MHTSLIFIQRCNIFQSPTVKEDSDGTLSLSSFQISEDCLKQGGGALVFFWGYSLSTPIDYAASLQCQQVELGKYQETTQPESKFKGAYEIK